MNSLKFNDIVEQRVESIRSVLVKKGAEYATAHDRFHNFRVAARMNDTTPVKALKGMMLKHEVSVDDLIYNRCELTKELIEEKIGDNINYLILLEGLLKEKLNEPDMGRL